MAEKTRRTWVSREGLRGVRAAHCQLNGSWRWTFREEYRKILCLFWKRLTWTPTVRGWNSKFHPLYLARGNPKSVFLTQARPLPKNHFWRRGSWTLTAMWETWPQESLFEPNDDWTQWWLQLSIKVGARVGRLSKLMKCISYYLKEPGVEGEVNFSSQGWWGKEVREGLLPRKLTNISPQERWLEGEISFEHGPFSGDIR